MDLKTHPLAHSVKLFQSESVKLALSSQGFLFGIAILDLSLRYVYVNERMAKIDGKPVSQHIGQTIGECDPQVALALEPILRQIIDSGKPLVGLEVKVPISTQVDALQSSFWAIDCYPDRTDEGIVQGVGVVVQDITDTKQKEVLLDERLKFEALLSTLSATFINIPFSEVDKQIEQGLQKIVEFLGFDRSTVWMFTADEKNVYLTHSYSRPGIMPPPAVLNNVSLDWGHSMRQGEIWKISDVNELPDSEWRKKQYFKDHGGIKSIIFIPASIGGAVVGFISFVSYSVNKAWPAVLIQRLRLLWEVFGNALERARDNQKIQMALAEIKELKERLEKENYSLRDQIVIQQNHTEIIGQSDAIRKVLHQVELVAGTESTVLILGETGTGKELIARAIHRLSRRKDRAMIKLNCAALPATLIEAELFGREKGAYTGALTTQIGRFEAADGSTIFLDEIGELPMELQAKLLRVLQEGQLEKLGSLTTVNVDVRIIVATNRNLAQAVKEGRFREDLYYRLNVFPLAVPPLRERREDIPLLVWAMVNEFVKIFGKPIESITKKNMEALERYPWPGNVRELRNMVERAMILNNSSTLVVDLPEGYSASVAHAVTFREMERIHILAALDRSGWLVRGKHGAAEMLELKASTLEAKMKKLGITRNKPSPNI